MGSAYIEVVLLDNFAMNLCVLLLCAKVGRVRLARWRALLSALLGALYAVAFLGGPPWARWLLWKVIFSAAMVCAAFPVRPWRAFGRHLATFYVMTLLLGGATWGLLSLLGGQTAIVQGAVYHKGVPVFALVGGAGAAYGAVRLIRARWQRAHWQESSVYRLQLLVDGHQIELDGLLDTGNHLREPLSGDAVVVAAAAALRGVLREEWLRGGFESMPCKGTRLVPYDSVGGKGLLTAVKIERGRWHDARGWHALPPSWLAISQQEILRGGQPMALLPAEICAEGDR